MAERLYDVGERNPFNLEPHYSRHVSAMTTEGLHEKADIAAELAFRDKLADALAVALGEIRAISADRESFVLLGPRAFIAAEQVAIEALNVYRAASRHDSK